MARMSIYVSDDLKARMDERPNANWSGVAQDAFEIEIRSTMKGDGDMSAVVERLRASKMKKEQEQKPDWHQMGREWAMHSAEYDELQRVAAIDPVGLDALNDDTLFLSIAIAIHDGEHSREDVAMFAEELTGTTGRHPSYDQMTWWLEGATEVWEEVKDQI